MNTFFIALILALQPNTPPKVIGHFENERDCRNAAYVANDMPQVNTPEARAVGAQFVCMALLAD